jgi:phosphoribosylaminoimidazole-succinocarboxamide synthase
MDSSCGTSNLPRICQFQGIPGKGALLTKLSLFWFQKLQHIIPHHVIAPQVPESGSSSAVGGWTGFPSALDEYKDQLEGRSMIVKKCEVIKVEAIVRGYITGESSLRLASNDKGMTECTFLKCQLRICMV